MSRTMSLRLSEGQISILERLRRRFNQRSVSGTLQLLLREKLREQEYAFITFRDSAAGRQAYLAGTTLAIWEIAMVARALQGNLAAVGQHLGIPENLVGAALSYARDFSSEVDSELAENDAMDFDALRRLLPGIERATVPGQEDEPESPVEP